MASWGVTIEEMMKHELKRILNIAAAKERASKKKELDAQKTLDKKMRDAKRVLDRAMADQERRRIAEIKRLDKIARKQAEDNALLDWWNGVAGKDSEVEVTDETEDKAEAEAEAEANVEGSLDVEKPVKRHYRSRMEKEERLRRVEWGKSVLASAKVACGRCGYNEFASSIDLHHVDPSIKVESISVMMANYLAGSDGVTEDLIVAEVGKCIPLCKNCHMSFHRGAWS